ncbi:hypothetical protein GQS_06610 [Thermococcus sp. 4557]|nr:hypothetical protein GQS_06610 [Thermococcus sp. 4557]
MVPRVSIPLIHLELLRFRGKFLLLLVVALFAAMAFGELSPVIPYFIVGFLFSTVFPRDLGVTVGFFLSKPFRRSGLFLGLLFSNIIVASIIVAPFAFLNPTSALYSVFALPFLPLGYVTVLVLRNPRKTFLVGIVLFLILTFVPPGIVQMKAQEKAQTMLDVHSLEDYNARRTEYHKMVSELEKRYTTYVFFSPGAQLELFARALETGDKKDAVFRLSLSMGLFIFFTAVSFVIFLHFEPREFLMPSPPSLYLSFLPWWFRKELANLWASRAFVVFVFLMLLPFWRTLKSFVLLFLFPLATLEVLSENPVLLLSKPVGRDYIIRRFLVVSALFAISLPFVGASFGVAFFLASLTFLVGLFTKKGALLGIPVLALLFAPAINSSVASLVFAFLAVFFLLLARFRLLRIDFSSWD